MQNDCLACVSKISQLNQLSNLHLCQNFVICAWQPDLIYSHNFRSATVYRVYLPAVSDFAKVSDCFQVTTAHNWFQFRSMSSFTSPCYSFSFLFFACGNFGRWMHLTEDNIFSDMSKIRKYFFPLSPRCCIVLHITDGCHCVQDCERNLLYDLVLKLKPNVFLPGDYICRKVGLFPPRYTSLFYFHADLTIHLSLPAFLAFGLAQCLK